MNYTPASGFVIENLSLPDAARQYIGLIDAGLKPTRAWDVLDRATRENEPDPHDAVDVAARAYCIAAAQQLTLSLQERAPQELEALRTMVLASGFDLGAAVDSERRL